jgi:RNA polymerase sigma factor (sigma-70 family)
MRSWSGTAARRAQRCTAPRDCNVLTEISDNVVMDAKSVAELVNAARSGSAEARDELVRRHYREAALLAAALVNDATEAEDLAQEAFIRAFRNLDLLVDANRFAPWLRRIVVGVSIDWLRAFRPALFRGWTDADDVAIATREPSPLDRVLRAEIVERVRAALDALPPRYRVPIRLYHLDGLSHAKIAATLDVPVATVRSLVARARRKVIPLLAEYAPDMTSTLNEVFEEQPVSHAAKTRFLHVANGSSTTMTIEAADIPGLRSIWADVLYEGPVPGGISDAELLEVRKHFLASPGDPMPSAWAGSDPTLDPVNDLGQWRAVIEAHDAYDELILWFEHDLFDQLNLIQLLPYIHDRLPATKPVSLICIGSFPGRPDFKGLGELTPDELASLLETRERISDAQFDLARRAWLAFRSPTPEPLDRLRHEDTSALPYLAAALTRFLQEYPWTIDGMSRTERRLLDLASGGGIALWDAFPHMHEGEQVYYVTDGTMASIAETLSHTSPALLTLDVSPPSRHVLRGTIALTDSGRSALAGQLDRVSACGIDRWLGGVHLQGRTGVWRWDEQGQRVTRI